MNAVLFLDLFLSFFKIGAFGFGGGYAMIPLITAEVVDKHGWLSVEELIDVIAISQATPGPISINAATYVGFKLGGFLGSTVSTLGVVLPSLIIVLFLAVLFFRYRNLDFVKDVLSGIRPVIVALIFAAALSVFTSSVTSLVTAFIAIGTVLGILLLKLDPILLLLVSGLLGWLLQF
jgi:chromate transporter